jgi:hypothetical protein
MSFPRKAAMPDAPTDVIGPFGEKLTLNLLPPANPARWTVRRKAELDAAMRGGLLTFDEACARYGLAMEELIPWQGAHQRSRMQGLRVTRSQEFRERFVRAC